MMIERRKEMKSKKGVEISQEERDRRYKAALYYRERGKKRREEMEKLIKKEAKIAGEGGEKFDVVAKCRRLSPKLIKRLESLALGSNVRPQARLHAIDALLDRAYGKPKETVEQKGGPRIIEIVRPKGQEGSTGAFILPDIGKDIGSQDKRAEN